MQEEHPKDIGFFGTRNMGYMHQQLIEVLSYAMVLTVRRPPRPPWVALCRPALGRALAAVPPRPHPGPLLAARKGKRASLPKWAGRTPLIDPGNTMQGPKGKLHSRDTRVHALRDGSGLGAAPIRCAAS